MLDQFTEALALDWDDSRARLELANPYLQQARGAVPVARKKVNRR